MIKLNSEDLVPQGMSALGTRMHWLRSSSEDNILICAQKLGVDYKIIENLESGNAATLDLELVYKFAALYGEKLFIGIGNDYV